MESHPDQHYYIVGGGNDLIVAAQLNKNLDQNKSQNQNLEGFLNESTISITKYL